MKHIYIFTLLFISTVIQAQEIEWQNTIGGNNTDYLQDIDQTTDGGYILGGSSSSDISGDKEENSIGQLDYWVVKLNNIGEIECQNTIGGSSFDRLRAISQTIDGGYILGGFSFSDQSGDKDENSNGASDYWVIKLDDMGEIEWQNTIGGNGNEEFTTLQQTADGGYIIGGHSGSGISGDKTEELIGERDYWILKLDATGEIEWQNTIGGDQEDHLEAIVQTDDGGYIIGGKSESNISGDKTENSNGDFDYWVLKLDATGNIEWQNTIGANNHDDLESIDKTIDGGYILGGYSDSDATGDKSENSLGSDDYWVVKVNAVGEVVWENTIGGASQEELYYISQRNDGNFVLGGFSSSNISEDKTEDSIGGFDYWVLMLNNQGDIIWQNTIGGSSSDVLWSLDITNDGGIIIPGSSASNISGDKDENSNGASDY